MWHRFANPQTQPEWHSFTIWFFLFIGQNLQPEFPVARSHRIHHGQAPLFIPVDCNAN
jgi:hypothetical protein